MAKDRIQRPDGASVKTMIKEAGRIDAGLLAMKETEGDQRRAAQQAAKALFDDRVQEVLEEMDVEHINRAKQGIRVNLLRENGIENIWQLSQMSFHQLDSLEGLGDQTVRKIQDTVKGIVENTKNTIRVRIRMENPEPVDDALVCALYTSIHAKTLRERGAKLYQKHHKPLQQELVQAKKATNGLGWLFKSQTIRQEIVDSVASLQARLEGEFGQGLVAWEAMENASAETCWADYRKNASAYYAELENLGLEWGKQETSSGLPAELAAQIEA